MSGLDGRSPLGYVALDAWPYGVSVAGERTLVEAEVDVWTSQPSDIFALSEDAS